VGGDGGGLGGELAGGDGAHGAVLRTLGGVDTANAQKSTK
jgi:hypothetical protein